MYLGRWAVSDVPTHMDIVDAGMMATDELGTSLEWTQRRASCSASTHTAQPKRVRNQITLRLAQAALGLLATHRTTQGRAQGRVGCHCNKRRGGGERGRAHREKGGGGHCSGRRVRVRRARRRLALWLACVASCADARPQPRASEYMPPSCSPAPQLLRPSSILSSLSSATTTAPGPRTHEAATVVFSRPASLPHRTLRALCSSPAISPAQRSPPHITFSHSSVSWTIHRWCLS